MERQRILEDLVAYSEARDCSKLSTAYVLSQLEGAASSLETIFEAVCACKTLAKLEE